MDVHLAIASKRDERRYSDRPIPAEVERRILDAGRLAGSARNRQPWEFVVVSDPTARPRVLDLFSGCGGLSLGFSLHPRSAAPYQSSTRPASVRA